MDVWFLGEPDRGNVVLRRGRFPHSKASGHARCGRLVSASFKSEIPLVPLSLSRMHCIAKLVHCLSGTTASWVPGLAAPHCHCTHFVLRSARGGTRVIAFLYPTAPPTYLNNRSRLNVRHPRNVRHDIFERR